MATEIEKKKNLARLLELVTKGLGKGLWDLVGEPVYATSAVIGDEILAYLQKNIGLEIAGESPEDVLLELTRIFMDEFGAAQDVNIQKKDNLIEMKIKKCVSRRLCLDLKKENIPPFVCPYLAVSAAAMRKNLGMKTRVKEVEAGEDECILNFEMI